MTLKRDKNNCAVRALAAVTQQPMEIVYDALLRMGRRRGDGTLVEEMELALAEFDLVSIPFDLPRRTITVGRALRLLDKDCKYLIMSTNHVAAVVDGYIRMDFFFTRGSRIVKILEVL